MRTKNVLLVVLGLAVVEIPTFRLAAQATASALTAAECWTAAGTAGVYAVADRCILIWIDSLRSSVAGNSARARNALATVGGRTAVDGLRAEYERTRSDEVRWALIKSMATTGSADDVAFLATQLQGPFIGDSDNWVRIQNVATTLGLLRATAARDSLQAALARNGPNGFAGRAVVTALASLDRPPCADSASGDLNRELVRIVMQCGPQSMDTTSRYHDSSAGGIWIFSGDSWRFVVAPAGTEKTPRVSASTTIDSDGRHADVSVSTWCGPLCAEGWTFHLVQVGRIWRVVSAVMNWVS